MQSLARADDRRGLEQGWPGLAALIDDTARAIAAQTLLRKTNIPPETTR